MTQPIESAGTVTYRDAMWRARDPEWIAGATT